MEVAVFQDVMRFAINFILLTRAKIVKLTYSWCCYDNNNLPYMVHGTFSPDEIATTSEILHRSLIDHNRLINFFCQEHTWSLYPLSFESATYKVKTCRKDIRSKGYTFKASHFLSQLVIRFVTISTVHE